MSQPPTERRRFHRIATDKPVVVRVDGDAHHGTVIDVSLRGLLFVVDGVWRPHKGMRVAAQLLLDGEAFCIDTEGEVVHIAGARIGVRLDAMDLESASRLRRMVELNLGDPELLERNLEQLTVR